MKEKNQERRAVPHNVFVTGIPQLIYSAGIPNLSFNQVILVQIADDSARDGNRPFFMTHEIMQDICTALDIPFKKIHMKEIQDHTFGEDDVVDCQIQYRLQRKAKAYKCKILAAQHEYVNIKRPRIFSRPSPSWKKRINFWFQLVLPNRMWRIFSLTPNPPFGLINEISLDQNQVKKFRSQINAELGKLDKYDFLVKKSRSNALFVLPIPQHWGGDLKAQKDFFSVVEKSVENLPVKEIIIKNHPSDSTDYLLLLRECGIEFTQEVSNLSSVLTRILPLEIIVESFDQYNFIGTESTVYLTLSPYVSEATVIIDCIRQTPRKLQEYQTGEIRSFYAHRVIDI
jgi:hypothetical protein